MRVSFIALAAVALAGAAPAQERGGPVVRTDAGDVAGADDSKVDSFRGIPFAAPPVGDLRWRAPQPVTSWRGVRQATRFADDCMQAPVPGIAAPLGAPVSEDCLYLNVWRPAGTKAAAKLPVMVWIHGGGFVNGGASPDIFQGDTFAQKGVIMVGIAYRVGRFGFFGHPALTAENKDGGLLGNYGLMDQVAALRWVQRNIARFGGDPANITIFGESAGGMSVLSLMTSPMSHGMFAKAIIQSGGGRQNLLGTRTVSRDMPGSPSLETLGRNFAAAHGITGTDTAALAALRALPAATVTDGLNMFNASKQANTYGGPAVDGKLIVAPADEVIRKGEQAKVPVMIGANSWDLPRPPGKTKEEAFQHFKGRSDAVRQAYDPSDNSDPKVVLPAIGGDVAMVEPARYIARMLAAQGVPTWEFRFSYVADSMRDEWRNGAPHASDVPYAMGTVRVKYGPSATARDIAMGETMNTYWANFAKSGNPNGAGVPQWPRYDAKSDELLDFAASGVPVAVPDPRRARLDAIEPAN